MCRQSSHHWFRQWRVAWSVQSYHINQSWNILDLKLRNKRQWNFNGNSNIFIAENPWKKLRTGSDTLCTTPAAKHMGCPPYRNGDTPYSANQHIDMMTSSNGNIFRVTGPLCWEFTGYRWIPLTKPSNAELWCFLWSTPWINGKVSNREAGDLRRHRAHYDVIVMNPTLQFLPLNHLYLFRRLHREERTKVDVCHTTSLLWNVGSDCQHNLIVSRECKGPPC